jgi:hypothetical protein
MSALIIKSLAGSGGSNFVVVSGGLPAGNSVEIRNYEHLTDLPELAYDALPVDSNGVKYQPTVFSF